MLLAAALFCVLELPGRRTGFTTYSHGWPFAYLERDYRTSAAFPTADSQSSLTGANWPELENSWQMYGYPLKLEYQMNPWSLDNTTFFSLRSVLLNLICGMLFVAITAWWAERRPRGRSWGQFRLRTLFGFVTLVAILCGTVAKWWKDHEEDKRIVHEIGAVPYTIPTGSAGGVEEMSHWQPPIWLPEGIAKLPLLAPWFVRVDELRIINLTPATFDELSRLTYLRRLILTGNGADGRALDGVAKLTNLEKLDVEVERCSGCGLAQLARLSKLRSLTIEGFGVDDKFVEKVSDLKSLETLEIGRSQCTRIDLHGLPKLRQLQLLALGHHEEFLEPLSEVANLPIDRRPKDGFFHPKVRVNDLPALTRFFSEGISVDDTLIAQQCQLPALEQLDYLSWSDEAPTPDFSKSGSIKQLTVTYFRGKQFAVHDMPALKVICVYGDLHSMHLDRLSALNSAGFDRRHSDCNLTLTGVDDLRSLSIESYNPSAPAHFTTKIVGLSKLSKLTELSMAGVAADPDCIDDFDKLTKIEKLNLGGTRITDAQLMRFAKLPRLHELVIDSTGVSTMRLIELAKQLKLTRLTLDRPTAAGDKEALDAFKAANPEIEINEIGPGFGTGGFGGGAF